MPPVDLNQTYNVDADDNELSRDLSKELLGGFGYNTKMQHNDSGNDDSMKFDGRRSYSVNVAN